MVDEMSIDWNLFTKLYPLIKLAENFTRIDRVPWIHSYSQRMDNRESMTNLDIHITQVHKSPELNDDADTTEALVSPGAGSRVSEMDMAGSVGQR